MATQNASVVELFNYRDGWTTDSLSLVKDPYSGKYYGADPYETIIANVNQATSYYSDIITRAESGKWGTQELMQTPSNILNGYDSSTLLSPYEEAKLALSNIQSNPIDSSKYVQQDQMLESYQAHPDGWNKYFETSYKSPRLQEDNAEIAQQNANAQGSSGGTATGNQLISSNLGIRKETGTGVGKSTVGLNPFGKLDAGLNI